MEAAESADATGKTAPDIRPLVKLLISVFLECAGEILKPARKKMLLKVLRIFK